MNILPIISRELRAEARHPVNYALRVFGAIALTLVLMVFIHDQETTQAGGRAFIAMSILVFFGIWIVVPILTADCLSREKREGTLGLLFLTPLKAFEIIVGKGAIHAIRSLTLLLALIPVITIPFILGGVTRSNVLASLFFDSIALILSLAAGLLASSLCRQWTRAIILAELFAVLFFIVFLKMTFAVTGGGGLGAGMRQFTQLMEGAYFSMRYPGFSARGVFAIAPFYSAFAALFGGTIILLLIVICFASRRLQRTWQENPLTARQLWIQKTFCTPRFWVGRLQRTNARRLTRNPIGWLQQYSWSARLSKWGWCFLIIIIVSWLLVVDTYFLTYTLQFLKTALLIGVAFSAVGSFQREKQNGALELLLVTPLQETQIIWGRLGGIWSQFLPAFSILLLTALAVLAYFPGNRGMNGGSFIGWVCDFLAIPVVGLYFAMRMKSFVAAWLLTCAVALFLPGFLAQLLASASNILVAPAASREGRVIIVQILRFILVVTVALWFQAILHARLKSRSFVLDQG